MSNQRSHVSYVELIRLIHFPMVPTGINSGGGGGGGGGGVTLMWPSGTLMLPFIRYRPIYIFFAKIPFRPRIVLSTLFVTKIHPEVCSSVCEKLKG